MRTAIALNTGMPDPGDFLTVLDRVTGLNISLNHSEAKAWLSGEWSFKDRALSRKDRAALRRFAKEREGCA